jgi:hypothetical protein
LIDRTDVTLHLGSTLQVARSKMSKSRHARGKAFRRHTAHYKGLIYAIPALRQLECPMLCDF